MSSQDHSRELLLCANFLPRSAKREQESWVGDDIVMVTCMVDHMTHNPFPKAPSRHITTQASTSIRDKAEVI